MGYKIAEEAIARGHEVTLISGPVKLNPPKTYKFIPIETAQELLLALKKEIKKTDCLIMCAAVSDFKAQKISKEKIRRGKRLSITFLPNKDILSELTKQTKYRRRNLFIGFNLETSNLLKNSKLKLKAKNLDIIVSNSLTKHHNAFGNNKIDVIIIDRFKNTTLLRAKNKAFVSYVLLDKIEEMWYLKKDSVRGGFKPPLTKAGGRT
jgi:phosphopantothenoylcysteine decarboxylase/phosphopantothenate--cysteine ligase